MVEREMGLGGGRESKRDDHGRGGVGEEEEDQRGSGERD